MPRGSLHSTVKVKGVPAVNVFRLLFCMTLQCEADGWSLNGVNVLIWEDFTFVYRWVDSLEGVLWFLRVDVFQIEWEEETNVQSRIWTKWLDWSSYSLCFSSTRCIVSCFLSKLVDVSLRWRMNESILVWGDCKEHPIEPSSVFLNAKNSRWVMSSFNFIVQETGLADFLVVRLEKEWRNWKVL